jgi:nitric oxide reductase subunit B
LVPSGFYQFYFAVRDGMWYARSPEIASGEVIRTLAKLRIGPDLIFAGGAALMLVFVARAVVLTLPEAVAEPVEMVREQDREFRVLGRA